MAAVLAREFFYPEDAGDTFFQNVGSHKIYTAPHPRRRQSSYSVLLQIRTLATAVKLMRVAYAWSCWTQFESSFPSLSLLITWISFNFLI
jgi:hypothetical protein